MLRLLLITLLVVITNAQDTGEGPPEGTGEGPPEASGAPGGVEGPAIEASLRCRRSIAEEKADALQLNSVGTELDELTDAMVAKAVKAGSSKSEVKIGFSPTNPRFFEHGRTPQVKCPRLLSNSWLAQESCPHVKVLLTSFRSNGFCKVIFPDWQGIYYTQCLCRECRGCERRFIFRPTKTRNVCKPDKYTGAEVLAICRRRHQKGWKIKKIHVSLPDGNCDCNVVRNHC